MDLKESTIKEQQFADFQSEVLQSGDPQSKEILNDDVYRRQALNTKQSFIVQAPAGSGKTTLLTERVLALLAECLGSPEECLCITFTQKAAAEMRERVLNALELASQSSAASTENTHSRPIQMLAKKVLERDAHLGWDLLNNPNRLRIQTIDSLCAELAQRMPLQSGIGMSMKITDTPETLYSEAAMNVLESLESNEPWSESLHIFLAHLDNDWEVAEALLSEMLSHRDQWLLSLGPTFFKKPERNQWEQGLQIAIKETLKLAKNLFPSECNPELLNLAHFAATQLQVIKNSNASAIDSPILHCLQCQEIPDDTLQDLPSWQGLAELLLTDANQLRKTVTERQGFPSQQSTKNKEEKNLLKSMKERMQNLLLKLNEFPDFCLALQYVRECPPAQYNEKQWDLIQALLTILPILVAELMLIFQKQGQVDFIEIALAAHRALGDKETPTDLALKFGYKTRHILVDEFQDTSLSQFLLIEKLTLTWSEHEGNTLFLVGDPMQSIYRFRRADVGLFIKAKQSGVNDVHLRSLKLSNNFRSHPCIIDWINNTFLEIFPKQDDILTGAIRYTPFRASKTYSEHNTEVIMHSVDTEVNEAEMIANYLEETKRSNPLESIGLLVRSRSHLKFILPILEKKGIPYQGVELEKLSSRPIIRDLLSLFNALIHLGDRIAWLSLLNSPLCGLSLKDLEILATFNEALPIFWSLQHYETIPELSLEAKSRLKMFVPIIEEALLERERLPAALWLQNTWYKLQLGNNRFDTTESKVFFKILRDLAKTQDVFTIDKLSDKINDHYATSAVNPNAVQIMTIHKAKGLEFDTVILAGLGKKERSDSMRLLLWEERLSEDSKPYLLLAPIKSSELKKDPIYEYLRKQEKRRAQYESQRLLYVAATRAKKRLYGFVYNESLFVKEDENFS